MAKVKTYTANARRTGNWWAIDVDGLEGVYSQARRLDQAEAMARDAIALFLDVPADSFAVAVQPHLEKDVNELVVKAVVAKGRAAAAQAEASNVQRKAVGVLLGKGLTTRDVGGILHLSHQRVAQLVDSPPERADLAAMAALLGPGDRDVDVYEVGRKPRRTTTAKYARAEPAHGTGDAKPARVHKPAETRVAR